MPGPLRAWKRLGQIILPVVFLVGAFLLFSRFGEVAVMVGYLRELSWEAMVLALLCQAGTYLTAARAYRDLLITQGHQLGLWHLFKVVIVSTSLSYAFPTWGVSGNAFLLVTLRRNDIPSMKGAVVVLLSLVVHLVTIVLFLLGSMAWLVSDDRLTLQETLVLSACLTASVALFLGWLWRLAHPERFAKAAAWLARWTREGLAKTFDRERIERAAEQLAEGRRVVVRQRLRLADPVLYRCVFFLLDCATLWILLRAMGVEADFGVATVGFTLGLVAGGLSLVPGGLGVTEVSMAFVLRWLGVDFDAAVVATLLFRLLSFWLPMPVGLFLYRSVVREAGEERARPRRPPRRLQPAPRGEHPRRWALFLLSGYPTVALAYWSAAGIAGRLGLSWERLRLAALAGTAGLLVTGVLSAVAALWLHEKKKATPAAALGGHVAAAVALAALILLSG